jgi:hypothetical protein
VPAVRYGLGKSWATAFCGAGYRPVASLIDASAVSYQHLSRHRLLEGASVTETARRMRTIEGNVKVLQYRALKYTRQLHKDDSADGEGDKDEQSP